LSAISIFNPHPIIVDTRDSATAEERRGIERVVRADAREVYDGVHSDAEQLLAVAAANERDRGEDFEQVERKLERAEADLRLGANGSRGKAFSYRFWGVVCVGAEFAMTWKTVPWVLDIPARSLLGVLVAAAPIAALMLVKEALDRVVRPAYRTVAEGRARWQSIAVVVLELCFLFGVIVSGALAMLYYLAGARELALRLAQQLGSGEEVSLTKADERMLGMTVLVTTLYVSIVGAGAFAYANVYAWGARTAADARRALALLSPELERKREAWRAAKRELLALGVASTHTEVRAGIAQEKYVATELLHLERYGRRPVERSPRAPDPLPTRESVEQATIALVLHGHRDETTASAPAPTRRR
jgi:hypothetical protein